MTHRASLGGPQAGKASPNAMSRRRLPRRHDQEPLRLQDTHDQRAPSAQAGAELSCQLRGRSTTAKSTKISWMADNTAKPRSVVGQRLPPRRRSSAALTGEGVCGAAIHRNGPPQQAAERAREARQQDLCSKRFGSASSMSSGPRPPTMSLDAGTSCRAGAGRRRGSGCRTSPASFAILSRSRVCSRRPLSLILGDRRPPGDGLVAEITQLERGRPRKSRLRHGWSW